MDGRHAPFQTFELWRTRLRWGTAEAVKTRMAEVQHHGLCRTQKSESWVSRPVHPWVSIGQFMDVFWPGTDECIRMPCQRPGLLAPSFQTACRYYKLNIFSRNYALWRLAHTLFQAWLATTVTGDDRKWLSKTEPASPLEQSRNHQS